MAPNFKENGNKKYSLTSIGAPKDGNLHMETMLFNIFNKLARCANAIKVLEYLILRERNNKNFYVNETELKRFCNLGSAPKKAFVDLETAALVECTESSIIIRYDNLLKE